MTTMMVQMLRYFGSITATTVRMRKNVGKHAMTSMSLERTSVSSHPPANPASAPTATPMSPERPTASRPTRRETLAPWTIRESTSRPLSSHPK